jgi:hypothetical protein
VKELKDLIYVVSRHHVREVDVITNPDRKPNKADRRYWEFYTGLREGRWQTDEEAARHFGMSPTDKSYHRLKNDLKQRLRDTVLFLDPESKELNEYSRRQQLLFKEWAQCAIIVRRGAVSSAIDQGWKCMKAAVELEQLEIAFAAAKTLAAMVATRKQYHDKYPELEKIIQESLEALTAETEIQLAYSKVIMKIGSLKGYKKGYAPEVDQWVAHFAEAAHKFEH